MDAIVQSLSTRDCEFLDSRSHRSRYATWTKSLRVSFDRHSLQACGIGLHRFQHHIGASYTYRTPKYWLEDVYYQCVVGCCDGGADCELWSSPIVLMHTTDKQQWYFWVEIKGKSLEEIDTIFDTGRRQSRSIAGAEGKRDIVANSTAVEMPPLLSGLRQVLPT